MSVTAASTVALAHLRAAQGPVRVHSRFASGVNLDLGSVLVFAGARAAGGACSLEVGPSDVTVLASRPSWEWRREGFVSADGTQRIDLSEDVVSYVPGVHPITDLDPAAAVRLDQARARVASPSWFDTGVGRDWGLPRLRAAVDALLGVAPSSTAQAATAVRAVVGLGAGLTPSGDDALIGALCLATALQRPAGLQHEDMVCAAAPPATTDISLSYLRLAFAGAFSSQLARVVELLGPPHGASADAELASAVSALAQFGATSGADTLVGLRLACELLTEATSSAGGAPRGARTTTTLSHL